MKTWQLALQPNSLLDNPTSEDLNRALRLLIDQKLILQEAEKIPTIVPTQKAISELLLSDYSRRGFFDVLAEPKIIDLLDLVALGTVADVARLK